ncbi:MULTISPECIES: hypothetical protein [Thermaerobacter]|uniref:Polysaccharide biosynthesis protein C-terminal domain-containing protein n=1 Tax=Thermaerobacter composti TaxID=554949 RepID=A0ABZ0QQL9_9FIRM|nr:MULTISPECIES: hypothetical protein [Thermaerobacter]QBS37659.1 hypothetical protein E1B22_07525 [Thermaerobacter sp. FW80]WPD19795.1 hypothetical protein Q5761_03815 [Thermaerobacter composti]
MDPQRPVQVEADPSSPGETTPAAVRGGDDAAGVRPASVGDAPAGGGATSRPRPPAGGLRRLARFYGPLAASDLLMAASEMAVSAGIARLAAPDLSLAAYGAVIATCLLIESPVIMLLHAGNALATHPQALRRLQRFTLLLAGGLTGLHAALAFTPLFDLYFGRMLGLDPSVLALVRPAFALMLPWTAAIAWRRVHQGLLIRHGHTVVASRGTLLRLTTLAAVMTLAGVLGRQPGAVAGCAGLAAAVTAECAYVDAYARGWLARSGWRQPAAHAATSAGWPQAGVAAGEPRGEASPRPAEANPEPLSWRGLLGFYVPLALTSVTTFAARPVLTGLLARSADAARALAAWPVVWGTVLLFLLPMRTVEQVAIAHGEAEAQRLVRAFALRIGLAGAAALALLAATPLAGAYLTAVMGVGGGVAEAARVGLLAMVPVPLVVALASCEAGHLVRARRTLFIHGSALANVAVLCVTAGLLGHLAPHWPGTRLAAVALVAAYLAEWAVVAAGTLRGPHRLPHGPGVRRQPPSEAWAAR